MSRLLVVTRPGLVAGFHLAGIEAYGAQDVEAAGELITDWLDNGETGLLAIEDALLASLDQGLIKRLEAARDLFYVPIPAGKSAAPVVSRKTWTAQMIRRAIGVHIAFKGEKTEGGA